MTRMRVLLIAGLMMTGCGGGGGGGAGGGPTPPAPPPVPTATAPTITGPATALAAARAGSAFAGVAITATGTGPITFAVTAGSIPEGMALNTSTGAYNGTPLVIGNFAFTVTATNSAGTATAQFTQVVNPAIPNVNVLLTGNRLASLNAAVPSALEPPVTLTGMLQGEELVAITRRPNNGFLYGVSVDGAGRVNLYALHPATGVATVLWESLGFFAADGVTPDPVVGTRFGAHVSPGQDVLRVVNDSGQNFRIDLDTGTRIDGNVGAAQAQMDAPINGATTRVDATAYTNQRLNSTFTTMYTLDSATDALCIQTPAVSGTQTSCQPLSRAVDAVLGFDIAPGIDAPSQNAPVTVGGGIAVVRLAGQTTERLVSVGLANGTVGADSPQIGNGGIRSLAIQAPLAIPVFALNADGTQLLVFEASAPGTVTTRTVSGIAAGEQLVAIEFRAHTGRLYGLAVNAAANTGTLYYLDPQSGAATTPHAGGIALVSDAGLARDLPAAAAGYGMDFNPTTDRIRVVAGNDLNFRINPNNGLPIDGNVNATGLQADANITPGGITVAEIAFTNSLDVDGPITTLYALDGVVPQLCIQSPANAGTLASCQALALGGVAPTFTHRRGFDIPGYVRAPAADAAVTTGVGYLAATDSVSGSTHLYEVELASGALTDRGAIGAGTTQIGGLTLGLSTVR
jgi:hypothetical protein